MHGAMAAAKLGNRRSRKPDEWVLGGAAMPLSAPFFGGESEFGWSGWTLALARFVHRDERGCNQMAEGHSENVGA